MRSANRSRSKVDAVGYCVSDTGHLRERNEDCSYADNELGLFIVADGLGGYEDGDMASALAVSTVVQCVSRHKAMIESVREGRASHIELASILEAAIRRANLELEWLSRNPHLGKMGCSVTALLVARSKAALAHVGDTRFYRLRGRQLRQLTIDHTIATDLVRDGAFSWANVYSSPYARYLTRAIGRKRELEVDVRSFDVAPGDRFVLCTNGLTRYLPDEVWLEAMVDLHDLEDIPFELVSFANNAGGEDNTTVVAVQIPPLDAPCFTGGEIGRRGGRNRLDRAA